MNNPIIHMEEIHKRYALDGVNVHALRGINFTVNRGDFIAIMGPSGSGKSTLMNIIGCLDLPDSGSYILDGQNVAHQRLDALAALRNRSLGFVFQNFNLLARTSALENVEVPLIYAGVGKRERRERATTLLKQVGLGDRLGHIPNQLSGGQQQRVAIARALVNRPALLLADEPTGNLDSATSNDIMSLLEDLNKQEHLTIVLITHEPDIAARTHRQMWLRDGVLGPAS